MEAKINETIALATLNMMEQRTSTQNNALHKYFELLAQKLNEGGFTVQIVIKQRPEVQFTPYTVKELLWRTFQEAVTGKKSTTQLTTKEISEIYEEVNKFIAENFWFSVPFPSNEYLQDEDRY